VPVLKFNLPVAQAHYAELGRAILPQLAGAPDSEAAAAFVAAISERVAAMPYAQSLQAAGVKREDLPMLAQDAMKIGRLLVNNPRDVTLEDALTLYQAAF
jgi:alcohol dehydrogenase class IV